MATTRADWPARIERWRERATYALVLAGALALPLVYHRDPTAMFRLPKAIFLRTEAMLIVAVTLGAIIAGAPIPRPRWRELWVWLPRVTLAAFGLLTLTSTNRQLSLDALGSAVSTAIVFFATVAVARTRGWLLVAAPVAAAVINALLVLVEETNLWMPFGVHPAVPHHIQCTALIGNPNEIGGYLGAATLAILAVVATRDAGDRRNLRGILIAAVLIVALIACQTLTAIVAFAAAAFFMMMMASWRNAVRAAAAAVIVAVLLVALVAPFRTRASSMVYWIRHGEYNALATERFTAFAAAWSMFADHPITGVGPGTFSWQYFDYKILAEQRYPSLRDAYSRGTNFGEVHNDHLQALAEGGAIGYAGFLALAGALGFLSLTTPARGPDWRQRFAHRLALPLAVFWIVLSIAQFPMETTVIRALVVHLAALCVGWRRL